MPRPEKVEQVQQLTDLFKSAKSVYIADYKGLSVQEVNQLRKKFREENCEYKVIKNTLARIAIDQIEELSLNDLKAYFQGPTAIAYSNTDDIAPGKIISEFDKKRELPKLKASIVAGTVYNTDETMQVVKLPSRDTLLAMFLNVIQSPLNGLVWSLNGMLQNLVGVIDAVKRQKEETAG